MTDSETLRMGLLMEGAQAQQQLAEASLEKLRAHTQGLDDVVREEIRRTLINELRELSNENQQAVQSLRAIRRIANIRGVFMSLAVGALCAVIPCAVVSWALPTPGEIVRLRSERDVLTQNLARLERMGGRVELRRCGETSRLCVRVDAKASAYGLKSDYLIVKGY